MKKKLAIYLFMLMSLFLLSNQRSTEYGHISYVEPNSQVYVQRLDGKKDKAIVNLPIVPGDKIISAGKSRCEIQFNNGTIIRLDHNTILKVVTILAETLTTKKNVSTLELSEGKIYIMSQVYNKEIFQIKTENTAALFKKNTVALLQHREKKTDIDVLKGSIHVIFGKDIKSIKEGKLKSKQAYTITSDNEFKRNVKLDHKDFLVWNKGINKNFDKLHRGKSKVPKAIYRYSKGIIHWAEKWSSAYGEWVYDEIYGYVWSPYDESFRFNHRPFFGAEFKTINGKLYCVPSQKWGWAPSQLGTWVFVKSSGWRWIPGSAFNGGIFPNSAYYSNSALWAHMTLNSWIDSYYGNFYLYSLYRERGKRQWKKAYVAKYGKIAKNKPNAPEHIKKIIKKLNRSYISKLKNSISQAPKIDSKLKVKFNKKPYSSKLITIGSKLNTVQRLKNPSILKSPIKTNLTKISFKDFNPDSKWALRRNVRIRYSSKTNEVICDNIKVYRKLLNKRSRSKGSGSSRSGSYSGNTSRSSSPNGNSRSSSSNGNSSSSSSNGNSGGKISKKK